MKHLSSFGFVPETASEQCLTDIQFTHMKIVIFHPRFDTPVRSIHASTCVVTRMRNYAHAQCRRETPHFESRGYAPAPHPLTILWSIPPPKNMHRHDHIAEVREK